MVLTFYMEFKYTIGDAECKTNKTSLPIIFHANDFGFINNVCKFIDVVIVGFLVSLIIGKCMMPTSIRLDKDAIYSQIAGFTSSTADVIDISMYMQNDAFAESYALMKAAQVVFGLSLTQFCFSSAAIKKRNLKLVGVRKFLDILVSTEAWSLLIVLFSQELPSYILRIILIQNAVTNTDYVLYFFVVKNGTMTVLLSFRIATLISRKYKYENKQTNDQD